MVWSHHLQKVPLLGTLYRYNYFALKRTYINVLRETGLRKGPTVVHWLCTNACNQKCFYCEASANQVHTDELKTHEIKAVIDDLAELEVNRFFISGGEPMVRKDLWEVLAHARNRGLTVGMISNSTLWERYKDEIREADFQSLWTSIDGLPETHDVNRGQKNAFEITLEAIRYYRELEIPRRVVNTLVHPGNLDELPELFGRLKEAGMNRWRFALATNVGRAAGEEHLKWILPDKQIVELLDWVEETRKEFDVEMSEELGYLGCKDLPTKNEPFICPAGLSFAVIMPDGNVLPCQIVYDNKYSEGNVRDQSFSEIWQHGFGYFRDKKLDGMCGTCRHRNACSGGCWGKMVNDGASCLRGLFDAKHYGDERAALGAVCCSDAEGGGMCGCYEDSNILRVLQ